MTIDTIVYFYVVCREINLGNHVQVILQHSCHGIFPQNSLPVTFF